MAYCFWSYATPSKVSLPSAGVRRGGMASSRWTWTGKVFGSIADKDCSTALREISAKRKQRVGSKPFTLPGRNAFSLGDTAMTKFYHPYNFIPVTGEIDGKPEHIRDTATSKMARPTHVMISGKQARTRVELFVACAWKLPPSSARNKSKRAVLPPNELNRIAAATSLPFPRIALGG